MTDKEKVRAEIERLYNQSLAEKNRQAELGLKSAACTSYGKSKVCKELLSFIDSMQEEPVSEPQSPVIFYGLTGSVGITKEDTVSEDLAQAIDTYLATYFGGEKEKQEWPFLKKMAIHFAEWKKQKDSIPVSEDLEEAAFDNAQKNYKEGFRGAAMQAFNEGALWQKQQDQSTIELAEDHAMFAGMEKMKEQMMVKAANIEVKVDAGGYPYIPQMELYDYEKDIPLAKEGDKYKVILIKED